MISNLGSASLLKMDIAIPCKDKAQCSDLTQNMPKMKSALLTKMDQGDMARLIQDRDFDTIKKIYLGVVNRFAEKPVDTIYIESFNY